MDQEIREFWDKRFGQEGYAYGTEPNVFFRTVIDNMPPGRIFVPGAGEGRDAVYAATRGWEVFCADLSTSGKMKAEGLAAEKNVTLSYDVTNINDVQYPDNHFDVIASIFFHLPTEVRKPFFANVSKWLKPGGSFISELFTPAQLANNSGGPKDADMLMTTVKFDHEIKDLKVLTNMECEIELDEGSYHRGKANVVRYIASK
jgi:SAM-dependent methyltransferase